MKYCPKCGFENANYAKFCVKCGNSFVDMDINTIKKHNSIMNSMYSKETSEISQKKKVNNRYDYLAHKIMKLNKKLLDEPIGLERENIKTSIKEMKKEGENKGGITEE